MHLRVNIGAKKATYILLFAIIVYYLFLKKRPYTETFHTTLDSIDPKTAWEYLADFSNQARFNPTIYDFEIDYEKGNYAMWEYGVTYKENLVLLPFISHLNRAVYRVMPENKKGHEPFRIDSEHICCMFFLCLKTDAQMAFRPGKTSQTTELEETVTYECPPILSVACSRELRAQKNLIRERLEQLDMGPPI